MRLSSLSLTRLSGLFLMTLAAVTLAAAPGVAQGPGGGGGGGGGSLEPGDHELSIRFEGSNRTFLVHVPASVDGSQAVPLVFDFHGFTSSAEAQRSVSGFLARSDSDGFVLTHPQGRFNSWNGGDLCCGTALRRGLNDVGFAVAIIDELKTLLPIDESRVYATGLSNGGALTHFIGCEAATVFAALAPVSMPLAVEPFTDCQPARAIPIIHFHGFNDTTVPYNGGGLVGFPPAQDSFAYWAQVNGCSGSPQITFTQGGSFCETFSNCTGGVETTLCSIVGEHVLYDNDDTVDIPSLALDLFGRHTLP